MRKILFSAVALTYLTMTGCWVHDEHRHDDEHHEHDHDHDHDDHHDDHHDTVGRPFLAPAPLANGR